MNPPLDWKRQHRTAGVACCAMEAIAGFRVVLLLCRQATLQRARRKGKKSFYVGVRCRYHRVRFDTSNKYSRAVQVWRER
jgi:hypothetical protein